jgi:hypothetical protein
MAKATGNITAWRSRKSSTELSAQGGRGAQELARANTLRVTLWSPESIYGGQPVTYLGGRYGYLYVGDEVVRRRK